MPTEDVCYKYDHLQNSVVALLELKKVAEKLDINTKTIKGRVSDTFTITNPTHPPFFLETLTVCFKRICQSVSQ
jgi:hypothetical protein